MISSRFHPAIVSYWAHRIYLTAVASHNRKLDNRRQLGEQLDYVPTARRFPFHLTAM